MDDREKALILQRIHCWRIASEFMEQERVERLRNMTHADTQRAIADLYSFPFTPGPERGSGLVEQQRLFHCRR